MMMMLYREDKNDGEYDYDKIMNDDSKFNICNLSLNSSKLFHKWSLFWF